MNEEILEKLKGMIARNDLHQFYSSEEWRKTAERARIEQHNECQRCKAKGRYSPCEIVHHKMYVKNRPELALTLTNLECLCRDCHEEEHAGERGFMNQERW